MTTSRKTFSVASLAVMVNKRNARSTCSKEERDGWNSALEEVLMSTGNYRGYRELTETQVPEGHRPGIRYGVNENGIPVPHPDMNQRFKYCDDSRRFYYVSEIIGEDYVKEEQEYNRKHSC